MSIRDISPADLAAVHAINQAEVPAVGSASLEHLTSIVDQAAIALVYDDGEIGGFALVLTPGAAYGSLNYRWFGDRYDSFIYLDRVAIKPSHQRRGIGRRLYAEVERRAADLTPAPETFALEVNLRPRNDDSLAFHAQLGFTEVAQRETDYGVLVAMMTKPLSAT